MVHIRQPIVSVLGHVDHGKSLLLDGIRGTKVAAREPGGITQHIGATEVPLEYILKICGDLVGEKTFRIPGLLFIDTPGHVAFTTLRARGGALADLAVLVVDVNEGFRPQTVESLRILKRFKTPFLVAANKIDLVPGWRKHPGRPFRESYGKQTEGAAVELDRRLYDLVGTFFDHGFTAERYDKVEDFRTTVGIVPTSAKFREGLPELLLVMIGLAQRYLEEELRTEEGPGEATILEVKEEKGLGTTVDAIVYRGSLKRGDTVVLGTTSEPLVTKVKAILKPKPLDEIRDPQNRFESVRDVHAAAGVKITATDLAGVVAGAPLRVVHDNLEELRAAVAKETTISVETSEEGVLVKADAIGSLEALAHECKDAGLPIKIARLGAIARRDLVDAETIPNPLHRAILAFNVPILPEAEVADRAGETAVLTSDVIYRLIDDYVAWRDERKRQIEEARRRERNYPGKLRFLPDHAFRVSKPAIFGVRVLAGRIRVGQPMMRDDGRPLGRIKSIRTGGESLPGAVQGNEVAIAIDGITIGRQVKVGDILFVDLPEGDARALRDANLSVDEREVLEQVASIKRKKEPFWGM